MVSLYCKWASLPSVPFIRVCGHTNVTRRVVEGKLVEEGKWPWQVSILFMGVYACSGSLFHEQWILTAAHCLQRSRNESEYTVITTGSQIFTQNDTQLRVSAVVIHKNFSNFVSRDIALLKLQDPVSWSHKIQPVCLPSGQYKPELGSLCWVTRWGREKKQGDPNASYSLQEIAVKIIKNNVCNQKYHFLLTEDQEHFLGEDMLCGSSQQGVESCQTNSGSPLVCYLNSTWIQMGLVSWSFTCGQFQFPSIYTSTSYFTSWIKSQVSDVNFISQAHPAFLRPLFCTSYILLVSLSFLWLL
ncbi:PREDICTED: serine protease 46-like [Elephantulus edwardii]|uniref:serine protease 46-like n=1 Tax=Elephantulus edwardii TaxID=28737 RepID=UPI0003F07DAF|nr:PREDICTED: serine protease 46-like [Elephantulus edwardii]